ncbi:S-layer homology domain-containing protein [Alkaliphilus peptidifermentans]|uniref:S-layer homology domain-containing protein n=1 Tax=Alkaliphilus peptidifermentans DSM 18978 TaxID=1120976 RepID=A0A1G5K802_9FIRM|nr:S-layer homology domain-containing protein [Alkaliphilus peptidifermentans]SCY96657.1 S-layer homology domain-containing protein [Alkaliphilus peptidifermentans DSM 18978]
MKPTTKRAVSWLLTAVMISIMFISSIPVWAADDPIIYTADASAKHNGVVQELKLEVKGTIVKASMTLKDAIPETLEVNQENFVSWRLRAWGLIFSDGKSVYELTTYNEPGQNPPTTVSREDIFDDGYDSQFTTGMWKHYYSSKWGSNSGFFMINKTNRGSRTFNGQLSDDFKTITWTIDMDGIDDIDLSNIKYLGYDLNDMTDFFDLEEGRVALTKNAGYKKGSNGVFADVNPNSSNFSGHRGYASEPAPYQVKYLPIDATSGTVPVDNNFYNADDLVTVAGNPGNLRKTGYQFGGWTDTTWISVHGPAVHNNEPITSFRIKEFVTLYPVWQPIDGFIVEMNEGSYTYDGTDQMSQVIVKSPDGETLTRDTDYTISIVKDGVSVAEAKNAGTYTVTVTGKGAYAGKSDTKTFNISSKEIRVSNSSPITKVYDGSDTIGDITLDIAQGDIIEGDSITVKFTSAKYTSPNAGIHNIAGNIVISGDSAANYRVSSALNLTGTITKRELTPSKVTVTDKVYDTNTNAVVTMAIFDNPVTGEAPVAIGTGSFEDASVGIDKTVTVSSSDLTLVAPWSTNYIIVPDITVTAKASITPAPISGGISIIIKDDNGEIGIAEPGDVLAADISALMPSHARTSGDIAYQWSKDGSALSGQTAKTYNVTQEDEGKKMTVTVIASGSYSGSVTSMEYKVGARALSGTLSITGTTNLGDRLTISGIAPGPVYNTDYTVQWYRDGAAISGAVSEAYIITADDLGTNLSVRVVATGNEYTGGLSSEEVVVTAAAPAKPSISANAGNGKITVTWQKPHDHGSTISGYSLEVTSGSTPITGSPYTIGADATSYTLSSLTNGTAYSLVLIAINSEGTTASDVVTVRPVASSKGGTDDSRDDSNSSNGGTSSNTSTTSTTTTTTNTPEKKPVEFKKTTNNTGTTITTIVTATTNASGNAYAAVTTDQVMALLENAKSGEDTAKKMIIEMKVEVEPSAKSAEVTIPREAFDKLVNETNADVRVDAGIGSVTFDSKAIEGINSAAAASTITIKIEKVETRLPESIAQIVGDRPVYDFTVASGDTQISSFGGGIASISIPYTLAPGEDKNAVVIYYIADNGSVQIVRGAYNDSTNTVDFFVSHFSKYAIGYNKVSFEDVSMDSWYADAVTFISARGITEGTSKTTFSPDNYITRGQFLVMLMRAYNLEVDANPKDNFADAGDTWYTRYLGTAKAMGIVNGMGNNNFNPELEISRQDMFTMIYRILVVIDELPEASKNTSLINYKDASEISDYAYTAIEALVSAEIVSGSNEKLNPKSKATRGQMAQIIFNLISE